MNVLTPPEFDPSEVKANLINCPLFGQYNPFELTESQVQYVYWLAHLTKASNIFLPKVLCPKFEQSFTSLPMMMMMGMKTVTMTYSFSLNLKVHCFLHLSISINKIQRGITPLPVPDDIDLLFFSLSFSQSLGLPNKVTFMVALMITDGLESVLW